MSDELEIQELKEALRDLSSDILQWLNWAELTGAELLPYEKPPPPTLSVHFEKRAKNAETKGSPWQGRPRSPERQSIQAPSTLAHPSQAWMASVAGSDKSASDALLMDAFWKEAEEGLKPMLMERSQGLLRGRGPLEAPLLVLSLSPDPKEHQLGEPYLGRRGQLLTRMLAAIALNRSWVHFSYLLPFIPRAEGRVAKDEWDFTRPYFERQCALISPKAMLVLGQDAKGKVNELLGGTSSEALSKTRPFYIASLEELLESAEKKREAWRELLRLRAFLREA